MSLVWNDSQKLGPHLNSEAGSTQTVTQPLFSPFFSGKTEKKGPPERVRTGLDGTSPRYSRSLFSSEPVSSFSNRKLNLRFDFFYVNL